MVSVRQIAVAIVSIAMLMAIGTPALDNTAIRFFAAVGVTACVFAAYWFFVERS